MSAPNARMLPTPSPAMLVDTFQLVMASANEWVTVVAQERTKREEISAWEKSQLELIRVQREFLLSGLDKTFDERRENFRRLFDSLDAALESDREDAAAQVSDLLETITTLAKTSPFKDLKSPTLVVQEYLQSGRVIEL
ncbi:hypothetical protein [Pseudoclavibacter helvolus]|uniref:hypothetical protein n=1 Tax=Pseudoclavibacter helvolus TaxID=255205 RepID=UPI0037358021